MNAAVRKSLLSEPPESGGMLVGWTVEQYHDLINCGGIPENPKTELIDGLLVWKDRAKAGEDPMTVGDRHRIAVTQLGQLAPQFLALGCFLQTQQPIAIQPNNEPEPDISVIRGRIEDFLDHPAGPKDTIFVLEVSDSSLRRDLKVKLPIYAQAMIPEYIVVNLNDNVVLVHRRPEGDEYLEIVHLRSGEVLVLSAGGSNRVEVPVSLLLG
jgi:Uma2 family endonuclease